MSNEDALRDLDAHEARITALAFLPDPHRPFLTTEEVMKLYGVSRATVDRWRTQGRIRGRQTVFRGHWRYHIADLLAYKHPPPKQ